MRNLDERMAEIALRSKKRIQARKKRRGRLLASCIPAVLCVGLCAGLFAGSPAMNAGEHPQSAESAMPPLAAPAFREAAVSGSGVSLRVTGREDVEKIAGLIQSAIASSFNAAGDPESSPPAAPEAAPYTIALTRSDGTVLEYTLAGNELTDRSTQEVYRVPEGALGALLDALGLPG